MANPQIIDQSFSTVSDVNSISMDVPSHQSGDVLFLFIAAGDRTGVATITTTATGWTLITSANAAGIVREIYYQVISSPLLSIPISFSGNMDIAALCVVARNISNASVVQASSIRGNTGFVHTANAVTTTAANALVFAGFLGPNPGTVYNSISGYNELIKAGRRSVVADPGGEMTVAWKVQPTASSTGAITTTLTFVSSNSPAGGNSQGFQIAVSASLAPTNPDILTPTTGETITAGRTAYSITWTPSTDPTIAASLLTYQIDYTNNGEITWNSITAATSAGVSSYTWNTSGLATGTYKIRIRAYNGTEYSGYDYSGYFSLTADAVPSKPTGLSPASGIIDRTLSQLFSWTFNDPGDIQKSYYIEYSVNADMSSSSNTGEQTTATSSHTFSGATFSAGYLYWRVKTKGSVDSTYSPFSDIATVLVAAPPSTPNITSPTAGSPPSTGNPTITWTSTGQVAYRIQVKEGGVYVYQGGWIASSQKSVTSPYTFKNGVSTVLYLAIQDSNGLSSAEDSETFTPSYTPPATPSILVTGFNGTGVVQIRIDNSDVPAYQYVYRYVTSEGSSTAIRISPKLAADATFLDYQAESGTQYTYFVRAFLSTGGFANSASATVTLTLTFLHIHTLTKSSTSSNANLVVALNPLNPMKKDYEMPSNQMQFTGRSAEVTAISQTDYLKLSYKVFILTTDTATAAAFNSIFDSRERVCVRDPKGNKVFGKISKRPIVDDNFGTTMQLEVTEEDFTEALL